MRTPCGKDAWNRRAILASGAAAAVGLTGGSGGFAQEPGAQAKPQPLPTRKLGKTGVELTILEQGGVRNPDRVIRGSFANGVRVFDTAKVYGTEAHFKKWFEQDSSIRKQIFLVTKDMPREPRQLLSMLDERLEALGTDYIDLFMIHGLGDMHSTDAACTLVKGQELKETAEKIRKSGKARLVGFSSHHKNRAAIIKAAAEGGIVDAIMLQYRPWMPKDEPLMRALDAAYEAGIGLISMKQIAGQFFGDKPRGDILKEVVERVPELAEKKLTPFQGLLHAIWSDERITAVCTSMKNMDQIRESADAARRFVPMKQAELEKLRDAAIAHGPMLCAECDGRCSVAAGTQAPLGDITRFLTYHQHHGLKGDARRLFAELAPEERDWSNADLAAAQAACPNRLDFARLLPLVQKHLT
jgi:aryl-alcohol dehydrogenase-like predicted oxidoreductase